MTPEEPLSALPPNFKEVCALANSLPLLQSMLYDLNLLPEQTMRDPVRWVYTTSAAMHFGRALTERSAAKVEPSEVREALEIARDYSAAALADAQSLYGQYPRDGLGRKITRAEEELALVERALSATPERADATDAESNGA